MFDVIRDILQYKDGGSLNRSDFAEAFNLYMIHRWISMYGDLDVEILSQTVNNLYKVLDDEQQFKLMSVILPFNNMKGRYIKAEKRTPSSTNDVLLFKEFEESSSKVEDSLLMVLGE